MKRLWSTALCILMIGCAQGGEQSPRADPAPRPDLSGMWSDPPSSAVDQFCFMTCTEAGIAYLNDCSTTRPTTAALSLNSR